MGILRQKSNMKTPFILLACLLVIVGAKEKWRCIKNILDIALKDTDLFEKQCVYGNFYKELTDDCTNYIMKNPYHDPVCTEDTLKKLCKRNKMEMENKFEFYMACMSLWGENQTAEAWEKKMEKQCNEEKILEIIYGDCDRPCYPWALQEECYPCVMNHQDMEPDCNEGILKKQCKQLTMKYDFNRIC